MKSASATAKPSPAAPTSRRFVKMHGLGNDFVVIDARDRPFPLDDARARAIANRRTGVGCDQLLILERPAAGKSGGKSLADVVMRIRNNDGGEVEACGNGARCVADYVMQETGKDHVVIETVVGLLDANAAGVGAAGERLVTVDMGPANLDWREIPLSEPQDTSKLVLALGPLKDPVAVNMGNPHAVFFVDDAEAVDIASLGPVLERHKLFPQRANIEVVQVLSPSRLRMRVWERGVGITQACGTGACATLVAAARRGLTGRKGTVLLDGGELQIEWAADGHVLMTGPVAISFTGELPE
jgi:diaminopimelate epimerase